MKKYIAVLPGDGVGPEVIEQAVKVLEKIGQKYNHAFIFEYGLVGAAAIEKTGNPLPDETLNLCQKSDAILFGAIGDPKYDLDPKAKIRPEQGLLKLRKSLNLYANLRPVKVYKELIDVSPLKKEKVSDVDFVVVRELTGGIYFGEHRRLGIKVSYSSSDPSAGGESRSLNENSSRRTQTIKAIDTCIYTKEEIIRVAKLAFELASKRKRKVTSVDKANVLETSRLWRETVTEIAKNYPNVELTHMFVDNAAMQLIKNPQQFDVILTENMFGDILTDEASVIVGSIGLLPSASISYLTPTLSFKERAKGEVKQYFGLYEPIHGAFNKAAGKNTANPIAAILSAAMMLKHSFNLEKEATSIEKAVVEVIKQGYRTRDISDKNIPKEKILGSQEMGKKIVEAI